MGQQAKKGSSGLTATMEIAIFVVIMILIQIPMIYVAGSDESHTANHHPLDQVFQSQTHSSIMQKMLNDKAKYIIVEGQADSGVVSFVKNFASVEKNKRRVLLRQYIEDPYQSAYILFRYAKTLVQDQLNLQEDHPKTWILFGFDKDIPQQDVMQIKQNNPSDKIVVVTPKRIKIKGFKHVIFPAITIDELKGIMKEELKISQRQVEVLVHHYQTIPAIFKNLNQEQYSREVNLGEADKDLSQLSSEQEQVLITLCQTGKASAQNTNERLQDVGVVFYQGKFYWASDQARLNFELKTLSECEHTVVSDEILTMIYQEQSGNSNAAPQQQQAQNNDEQADQAPAEQEQNEQEGEEGQEQEEEEKKSKKKDKKKKDKKKKKEAEENNDNQNEEQQEEEEKEEKKDKKKSKKNKKEGDEKSKKKNKKKNKKQEQL